MKGSTESEGIFSTPCSILSALVFTMTLNFLTPGHHAMKKSRGQKGNYVYNTRVAKTENFIFAATIFEKKYDLSILRFEFSVLLN